MEPIKAFSNVVIGQFVLTRIPVKVYVYGRYLTITSTDDVQDPLIGFGMDEDGQMQRYDYRTIEHLLISGNVVDLDTYNKAMGAEEGGEEGDEDEEKEGEEGEDLDTGEEEPKKEESIQMTEISKDVLKAKLDVIKKQEKELKDKEAALKKEPVEDGIVKEDHGYTFGTGDIVTNKNKSCAHYGSKGIVQKIMDLPNGMGQVASYRVTNNGNTFKVGDMLTKTLDQLEKYYG